MWLISRNLRLVLRNYLLQEFLILWYDWICIPFCKTICLIQMSNKGSKCGNVTFTAFSSHSFRIQTWQFLGKCILQRWFFQQFWQHCLNKTSALHTELQYDSLADSFCFGICNTQWEVLLSKQVNYNQVMVKCQILQQCFLQNFNMQNFKIWSKISKYGTFKFKDFSRTYKDFQGPTLFSETFKGLEFFCQNSRTLKDFSRTLWTLTHISSTAPYCFTLTA